jgi:hypothetical protein
LPSAPDHSSGDGTGRAWTQALAHRFPELGAAPLATLAAQARREQLGAHATLLAAGAPWQHAFWVERGMLRLFYIDSEGCESNKNFHAEDAFIWPVTDLLRHEPAAFFHGAAGAGLSMKRPAPCSVFRRPPRHH